MWLSVKCSPDGWLLSVSRMTAGTVAVVVVFCFIILYFSLFVVSGYKGTTKNLTTKFFLIFFAIFFVYLYI